MSSFLRAWLICTFFFILETQSVRYQQQKRAIPSLVSKGNACVWSSCKAVVVKIFILYSRGTSYSYSWRNKKLNLLLIGS